jgi:hypothetical protein
MLDWLIESAAAAYMPKLAKMAEERTAELAQIRSKIRTDPEKVEEWFDREIEKVSTVDAKEILKNFKGNATAGI